MEGESWAEVKYLHRWMEVDEVESKGIGPVSLVLSRTKSGQ